VGGDEAGDELLAAYRFARAPARARGYFISLLGGFGLLLGVAALIAYRLRQAAAAAS